MRRSKHAGQRSLHWQVARELAMEILEGTHAARQALPPEVSLCERFEISRTALREALRVLVAKSLIEARPRQGTVVRPSSEWNYLDPDVISWRAKLPDLRGFLRELHEMRFTIEPPAAALTAARGTDADIGRLRDAYESLAASVAKGSKAGDFWIKHDVAFHEIILEACGNPLFGSMRPAVSQALYTSIELTLSSPGAMRRALSTHLAVLEAIEQRDATLAHQKAHELLAATEHDIDRVLLKASAKPIKEFRQRSTA